MRRAGGGGRLGVGAIIGVLALAALAAQWMRHETAPRAPASSAGATLPRAERAPVADAAVAEPGRPAPEATDEAPVFVAERGAPRAGVAGEPGGPPEIRLPVELGPLAPDVVVALRRPEPGRIVPSHAHVPDGAGAAPAPALGLIPSATSPGNSPGPSEPALESGPTHVYWFGPQGLEKVPVLTEEPR